MTVRSPVLEFNCRFGDPETQPTLMRLDSDLLDAFEASTRAGSVTAFFRWSPDPSVCVVIAAGGYPGRRDGKRSPASAGNALDGVQVFRSGTSSSMARL